jgi:hypothetical protein
MYLKEQKVNFYFLNLFFYFAKEHVAFLKRVANIELYLFKPN